MKLTPEDILKEFIFLGLRKTEGINLHEMPDVGGSHLSAKERLSDAGKELVDGGYLESRVIFSVSLEKGSSYQTRLS